MVIDPSAVLLFIFYKINFAKLEGHEVCIISK